MQAVVNHRYKYIMLYSAKVGCTSLRTLFLDLHQDEMTPEQTDQLNSYHNINEVFPFDPLADYTDYYKFYISRNPYARIVSAYLDQYVYARHEGVETMFEMIPPKSSLPDNFVDFLEYLQGVPDELRDSHFQTQSYLIGFEGIEIRSWFRRPQETAFLLDFVGDISKFVKHLKRVYRKIFNSQSAMKERFVNSVEKLARLNPLYYGPGKVDGAASISVAAINELVFSPKPQDFFDDERAVALVQQIYAKDFQLFGYALSDIPSKQTSPELAEIPDDFDWETYLMLSPDLPLNGIETQRTVLRHYLEFGRFEIDSRSYKVEAPHGFEWRQYLDMHPDLVAAGIDNERNAIIHYLSYGRDEGREY